MLILGPKATCKDKSCPEFPHEVRCKHCGDLVWDGADIGPLKGEDHAENRIEGTFNHGQRRYVCPNAERHRAKEGPGTSATQGTVRIPASILWLGESTRELFDNSRLPILGKFRRERHDDEPTFRRPLDMMGNHDIVVLVDNCKYGKPDVGPRRYFVTKAWNTFWRPIGTLFVLTPDEFVHDYDQMLLDLAKKLEARIWSMVHGFGALSDPNEIVEWAREKFPAK